MDWFAILSSLFALALLAALLWWLDRRCAPQIEPRIDRRHHDHLLPDTPRVARRRR